MRQRGEAIRKCNKFSSCACLFGGLIGELNPRGRTQFDRDANANAEEENKYAASAMRPIVSSATNLATIRQHGSIGGGGIHGGLDPHRVECTQSVHISEMRENFCKHENAQALHKTMCVYFVCVCVFFGAAV